MKNSCIFCKIISREIPSTIIAENNDIIAIKDIAPKTPIHYLIIPKKHIEDIRFLNDSDINLLGKSMLMARDLSQKLTPPGSFRLLSNNGKEVGQRIFHIHFHFLAEQQMNDF